MSDIIVSGALCTWWDSIDKTSKLPDGLPCCPGCGGVLFQYDNEAAFMVGAPKYEANGHPGYVAMLKWARGKCFRSRTAMNAAYTAETGIVVP